MPQHPDFVNEFLEQAQTNPLGLPSDETAVQSQIAENTRSAEEVKAAFQAMQQAQQPTTFDKIGDVALAVAAIADLTTGDKRKRGQAGVKFRSLRAGRTERKQTKRDQQFQKFIQKMKLREFTGDIASKNLALALGISEREAQGKITKFNAELAAFTAKSQADLRTAQETKLGEKPKGPTQAEIDAANKQALGDFDKDIYKQALDTVGKFDPGGEETYEQYLGRVQATYQQIWIMRNAVMNPQQSVGSDALPGQTQGVSGLIQPELLPEIGMRDLIGTSNFPAVSTRTDIPVLSPAELARLGLGFNR